VPLPPHFLRSALFLITVSKHVALSAHSTPHIFLVCRHAQGGLRVQLGGRLHGTVALSDVHDVYVPNALEGLQAGSYVRARVLSCEAEGGKWGVVYSLPGRAGATSCE